MEYHVFGRYPHEESGHILCSGTYEDCAEWARDRWGFESLDICDDDGIIVDRFVVHKRALTLEERIKEAVILHERARETGLRKQSIIDIMDHFNQ